MTRYTVSPGRILCRDGVALVMVSPITGGDGLRSVQPAEADQWAHEIAAALNLRTVAKELRAECDDWAESLCGEREGLDELLDAFDAVEAGGQDFRPPAGEPPGADPVREARRGLQLLTRAREAFAAAGAGRTLERIRLAISSAKGAVRHAEGKAAR